ncbi:MAG: hypothetical protein LH618_18835, partial [Saprospiraceae bacterium]|nr:hypothetical protein [Saprospiraceae bacterium]
MELALHPPYSDDSDEVTQSQVVSTPGNTLFPIFLKLEQIDLLIVGGGYVGLEKITAVLRNSPTAQVTLVGREIRPDLRAFVEDFPQVILQEKRFEPTDLVGKQLV